MYSLARLQSAMQDASVRAHSTLTVSSVYIGAFASYVARSRSRCKMKTRTNPLADVFNLVDENRNVVVEKSATPTVALDRLSGSMPESASGRAAWRANARVAAVLGSYPRSHKSFKSGDPLGSCSVY